MSQDLLEGQRREDLIPAVAQLIQGLPKEEQLVLALYYVEELTLAEIGTVLDLPEDRVLQLYTVARRHLRTQLSPMARQGGDSASASGDALITATAHAVSHHEASDGITPVDLRSRRPQCDRVYSPLETSPRGAPKHQDTQAVASRSLLEHQGT